MTAEYKNWQEEFVDINFTDQRLKSRFFKIIDAFAASPGKSTWAATGSRSSAKAAYRFFSNSEISKDELLDSISRATVEKIKLLYRNNLKFDDLDLWEIHEAFASQVLATIKKIQDKNFTKKLGIDFDFGPFPMGKLNPNGSSISIGHPFGATGARILSQSTKDRKSVV